MIKAVVFDLDGLLVDSEPVWFEAIKDFLKQFNIEWTEEDQIKQMGARTDVWADNTFKKIDGRVSHEKIISEILGRMISFYESGEIKIMPSANEALKYCSKNYIVGLASGSPIRLINAALNGADWTQYFREVVSSDEVINGKPAPDSYLEIYKRLNIRPEETVVIEDSGGGIMAGYLSGAKVIAIPNPGMLPSSDILSKATIQLETLHNVPLVMENLKKE